MWTLGVLIVTMQYAPNIVTISELSLLHVRLCYQIYCKCQCYLCHFAVLLLIKLFVVKLKIAYTLGGSEKYT